jgi:hypothetical protein
MLLGRHPARGVLATARTGSPPRDAPAARPGPPADDRGHQGLAQLEVAVGCEQPPKAASSVTATGWSPTASAIPRPATSCRHRASHGSGAQRPDEFVRLLLRQLATALRGRCPPISRVPSGQVVLLAASAAKQFAAFRLRVHVRNDVEILSEAHPSRRRAVHDTLGFVASEGRSLVRPGNNLGAACGSPMSGRVSQPTRTATGSRATSRRSVARREGFAVVGSCPRSLRRSWRWVPATGGGRSA